MNYREKPLSDSGDTSQYRRGPRSLPPLWHTELIRSIRGWTLSVRVNRSGCESDTSPPSSDEVKNAWSYASSHSFSWHDLLKMELRLTTALCKRVFPPYILPLYPLLMCWIFFFALGLESLSFGLPMGKQNCAFEYFCRVLFVVTYVFGQNDGKTRHRPSGVSV